ncbi:SyrB-like regulator [Rhizobium rhizogenes]|uniref:SyrB-like regulator n=1 Tax=Rhizobium rhizogenes TaxID=359 RepID=UPI0015718E81|nr:SyrB-like regulator [Rhizobium rhizogenes]NTF98239.1 SyrB-like regulator [Rhizobium rhizogenes]
MADETTTETAGAQAATEALTSTPAIKKTRAPRRPKTAEAAPVEATAAPAKKTRAKRGSKLAAAKADKSIADPKKATRALRPQAVAAKAVGSMVTIDDIADLITLEEENKQLRKQLSEKLRAENADLRKRLGQN